MIYDYWQILDGGKLFSPPAHIELGEFFTDNAVIMSRAFHQANGLKLESNTQGQFVGLVLVFLNVLHNRNKK